MSINLPPRSTYRQSFNFRSTVVDELSFDQKELLIPVVTHPPTNPATQLAQFDPKNLSWARKITKTSKNLSTIKTNKQGSFVIGVLSAASAASFGERFMSLLDAATASHHTLPIGKVSTLDLLYFLRYRLT